jgi:hypothetical protein
MSAGNATFVPAVMITGGAPDQRRATPEATTTAPTVAAENHETGPAVLPSVTISASAISVKAGDTLLGTIIGPDARGNQHFVAAQGIFSVDPQSALEGLGKAAMLVTSTNRGIEAVLTPDVADVALAPVAVKLQLVQANITQLTTILDTHDVVASDTPITLATAIGAALRSIGQVLPQGFSFTPQAAQIEPAILAKVATPILSAPNVVLSDDIAASILAVPAATTTMPLAVGLSIKLRTVSVESSDITQNIMSLLTDLPDSKSNRALILQSPLFANLLKSGRLIVVASPPQPQAQAQILSQSDVALLATPDEPSAPASLQTTEDQPISLAPGRLLLLLSTAPTKTPPMASDASIDEALILTSSEDLPIGALQNWLADRALQSRLEQSSLPTLKPELSAEILLLFNVIGRKLPSPALRKLVEARYVGNEPTAGDKIAMENIAQLVRRAATPAATAEAQQRLVVPLHLDGQVVPLVLIFSAPQERDFEQNRSDDNGPNSEKEQIFALSIEFTGLGPLTLRGRCDTHSLNLAVETEARLPESLETSAKAVFFETLEAASMNGQLRFGLTSDRGWQNQSTAL